MRKHTCYEESKGEIPLRKSKKAYKGGGKRGCVGGGRKHSESNAHSVKNQAWDEHFANTHLGNPRSQKAARVLNIY